MKKKQRLERVTITRRADGLFDVTRERAESGETCAGCRNLEDAFEYVRAIYDENGNPKPCQYDSPVPDEN